MIKVVFYQKDRSYIGFSINGHAGYETYGKDIVCSAVTTLAFNTVNSIEAFTDDKFVTETTESGSLKFKFVGKHSEESQLLIKTLRLGLSNIYEEYGNKYLQLYFKEV